MSQRRQIHWQPRGNSDQLLQWRVWRGCEQLVPNVLNDQPVAMRLSSDLRPFRVITEVVPGFSSLVGILERHQISQLVVTLADIGSPVAYVLDAVLFKKLGRMIGESSVDCG